MLFVEVGDHLAVARGHPRGGASVYHVDMAFCSRQPLPRARNAFATAVANGRLLVLLGGLTTRDWNQPDAAMMAIDLNSPRLAAVPAGPPE